MPDLTFHTLDVFTDRVFGGNPLAVFPDAPDLDDAVMQAIAREFNLSETVFVRPSRVPGALRRLRIFTVAEELPFAGHPTIGTAQLLVELGLAPRGPDGAAHFALEEGVGLVPVSVAPLNIAPAVVKPAIVAPADGGGLFTWLTAARIPARGAPPPPRETLAALLGLAPDDVLSDARDAPAIFSAGVPFAFVPLRDRAALARARLDVTHWQQAFGDTAHAMYLFCHAAPHGGPRAPVDPRTGAHAPLDLHACAQAAIDLHARMFAPAMGIVEDAATGSAAASLVGYLWERDRVARRWLIAQGEDMGRPSTLHIEAVAAPDASQTAGALTAARVGGRAVRVSRGTLSLPQARGSG